jgi:hypothetical protein
MRDIVSKHWPRRVHFKEKMCGRKGVRLTESGTDGSVGRGEEVESNGEAEETQDKICKRDVGRGEKKD